MRVDDVAVPGGTLRIARFGRGPRLIVAIHGISASLMSWATAARALPQEWSLVAMDLRGRGHSAGLPGPYGLDRHAEDVAAVADYVGAGPGSVLTGHSMGAYIAALLAAQREFARVVLVDALPLEMPPGLEPDQVLEAALGPAIARLSQTFPSVDAYLGFFRQHPALADSWTTDVEEYVRYDATGPEGALRSRVQEQAVRQDGRWQLTKADRIGAALHGIKSPLTLLRAPRGLLNQPTGLVPDDLRDRWAAELPGLTDELIPDCNHYTILFDDRCARRVAEHLTGA